MAVTGESDTIVLSMWEKKYLGVVAHELLLLSLLPSKYLGQHHQPPTPIAPCTYALEESAPTFLIACLAVFFSFSRQRALGGCRLSIIKHCTRHVVGTQ